MSRGCKKRTETIVDNSIKSEKLTSFENSLIDTMIFETVSVIPLETDDESLFRDMDIISITNDRIYIFDNRLEKICIFDNNGKYINKIHSIGPGPEEYIAIIDFCVDEKNKEIIVLCDRPYKLMRFSLDGDFIRQTTYSEFYKEISIESNSLFCLLSDKIEYEIGCFNQEFQLTHMWLAAKNDFNKDCYNRGYSLVKSKHLNYTRRFDPSLYQISTSGIEKKYEFDLGKYTPPGRVLEEEDCRKLSQMCREGQYIYSMTNAVESDKHILFSTNIGICLYEKETNKLTGYKMLYCLDLNAGRSIYYPNEGDGNSIITYMEASSLGSYKEETIKNNPIINNLVKNVKPDDNPILFVHRFR